MTKEMLLEDHYIDDYVDDHVDREIESCFSASSPKFASTGKSFSKNSKFETITTSYPSLNFLIILIIGSWYTKNLQPLIILLYQRCHHFTSFS